MDLEIQRRRSMVRFSPELTFIPAKYPHEIRDVKKGEKIVGKINTVLLSLSQSFGHLFYAKLDPFKFGEYFRTRTHIIEIVPFDGIIAPVMTNQSSLRDKIDSIFALMKKFGYVPLLYSKRSGVIKEWPTGGCHFHMDANLFFGGETWYKDMERFHRNLVMDYSNRPYLRWLLSQWFDDRNSSLLTKYKSKKDASSEPLNIFSQNGIEPRFMGSSKRTYMTFEFRFINMVQNGSEVMAIYNLLDSWMSYILLIENDVKHVLNGQKFFEMGTLRGGKKHCMNFIDMLGLNWQDYEVFYNRNFVNRSRYGKLL